MGGPLSALLANVYMDRLERWTLKYGRGAPGVVLWYRFVDDIFCIGSGTQEELNLFTHDLQRFDGNLKFDITDAGHSANFLDVTIRLLPDDIQDDLLTPVFSIYRKPQYTDVSIHQRSLHPPSQKLSVIHSAVTHLLRLPLSQDAYDTEIDAIEQIVKLNDLKVNVPKLIKRRRLREILSSSSSSNLFLPFLNQISFPTISYTNSYPTPPLPSSSRFWIRLPYLGRASNALASEFKRYGYNIGFYPLTQVKDLSRLKDPTPKLERPGVYKLLCSCGDLYVGQTGRTITERFKEHRRDFKSLQKKKNSENENQNSLSAMARHCFHKDHKFDDVVTTPLQFCNKGRRMDRLEEYYILQYFKTKKNNVLNDSDFICHNNFVHYMSNQ